MGDFTDRRSGCLESPEDAVPVGTQRVVENEAQNAAGENLTDADRQHHERDRQIDHIGILEDKGYDKGVRDDRRNGGQEGVRIAQLPCEEGPGQGGKAATDDIREQCAANGVADQAADEETGNCVMNRRFLFFIFGFLLSFVLREDGFELTDWIAVFPRGGGKHSRGILTRPT